MGFDQINKARRQNIILNGNPFLTRIYNFQDAMDMTYCIHIRVLVNSENLIISDMLCFNSRDVALSPLQFNLLKNDVPVIGIYMSDTLFDGVCSCTNIDDYFETNIMPLAWLNYKKGDFDKQMLQFIQKGTVKKGSAKRVE